MAAMIANGLFNAVSFAGASFIFSQFSHHSYEAEMKRHDKAMEQLQKDRDKFFEEEAKKKDELAKLYRRKKEASEDVHATNQAFEEYHKVESKIHELQEKHAEEPRLDHYYTPSPQFKRYIVVVNLVLAAGVGYAVYKVV